MTVTPPMTPLAGTGQTYEDQGLSIHDLFQRLGAQGAVMIEDHTFNRCMIQGPAVLLALGGVVFDNCDMGPSGGDIRNLLFKPVGVSKAIGAISIRRCRFVDCAFYAIGFTGTDEFLDSFQDNVRPKGGAA